MSATLEPTHPSDRCQQRAGQVGVQPRRAAERAIKVSRLVRRPSGPSATGHQRAINPGAAGSMTVTGGPSTAQLSVVSGLDWSDSQADSAGSIPVTRCMKPQVSEYALLRCLSRWCLVDPRGPRRVIRELSCSPNESPLSSRSAFAVLVETSIALGGGPALGWHAGTPWRPGRRRGLAAGAAMVCPG
jgi:hypothetical protein